MVAISQATIDRARTTLLTTLMDTVTVQRTNKTYPCRISEAKTRQINLDGIPDYMRARLWKVTLPWNADVVPGDRLTHPTRGTYSVTGDASPSTINIANKVYAYHDGFPEIYHVRTHQVTFRQAETQEDTPLVWVTITPVDTKLVANRVDWIFTHEVTWSEPLAFTNLQPVSRGDLIRWPDLANGQAELDYPRRYPAVNVSMANFRDQ